MQTDHGLLMTPAETVKALRTTAPTLARWARRGQIPFVTLPSGGRRYRRADVDAILAGDQPTTSTAPDAA